MTTMIRERRGAVSIASHIINLFERRVMPWAEMILLLNWKIHFPPSSCRGAVFNSLSLQANLSPWPRLVCCERRRQIPWAHVEPLLGKVFVVLSVGRGGGGEKKKNNNNPIKWLESCCYCMKGNMCCMVTRHQCYHLLLSAARRGLTQREDLRDAADKVSDVQNTSHTSEKHGFIYCSFFLF